MKITRHSKSILFLSYGGPNPPRVPYQLITDNFWFSDSIDQRSYNYIMLTTKNLLVGSSLTLSIGRKTAALKVALSEASVLSRGVPQGSTIGPNVIPFIYK